MEIEIFTGNFASEAEARRFGEMLIQELEDNDAEITFQNASAHQIPDGVQASGFESDEEEEIYQKALNDTLSRSDAWQDEDE